jgi:predicted GNAT superfamily acetyltransferase
VALDTVADYVTRARVLLQDTIESYRYSDADLVEGLNQGLMESRRLRPDLFIFTTVPSYTEADIAAETAVEIDEQFRVAYVYYMVGNAHLRDEEDTADARAAAFLNKFIAQLQTVPS